MLKGVVFNIFIKDNLIVACSKQSPLLIFISIIYKKYKSAIFFLLVFF